MNPIQQAEQALWTLTEHAALYYGEQHNTVIEGRAALSALQSLQGVELPPLPPTNTVPRDYYTADQMRTYARTAVAAAMARGAVPHTVIGWLVSNSEGDDEFINNPSALKGRHYKGREPVPLLTAAPTPDAAQPTQAEAPSEREALLPCPFCGNEKNIAITNEKHDHSGGYYIACPVCDASTGLRFACGEDPGPLLIEQWNRRTALATQQAGQGEAAGDWIESKTPPPDGTPVLVRWPDTNPEADIPWRYAVGRYESKRAVHHWWDAAGGLPHSYVVAPSHWSAIDRRTAPPAPQQAGQGEAVAWRFRLATDMGWSNWRTDKVDHDRFKREGYRIEYAYAPPAPQQPEALAQQERERAARICEVMRPTGGRAWSTDQRACFEALTEAAAAIRAARSSEGGSPSPSMVGREGE